MSRRIFSLYVSVVLLAITVPVAAQNNRIVMSIPHDFTVSKNTLAAGQYIISRPLPNDLRVFAFRGEAKHQKTTVTTNTRTGDAAAQDTELVFARYGETYFLRSIRVRGSRDFYDVPMSSVEKEAAAKDKPVMLNIKADGH